MWRLWAATLAMFLSLACSSAHADVVHFQHNHDNVATRDVGSLMHSWHWAQNILQAVMMMSENKDWMADSSQCAIAVNNTLERLANEYTDLQVGTVLSSACDHMNIYADFGGHTNACRPVFGDLAEVFEGDKDYASWCEQAASMIAADVVHHKSKKEMVDEAKAELAEAEAKRARGDDISEELKKVKEEVNEAEKEGEEDATSDGDKDIHVGQARFGSGENTEVEKSTPPKEDPSKGPKVEMYPVTGMPFGNKPKADTLTKNSISETEAMVDQVEKAQTAEEKRSAYRALTRLRGAMTTSYDAMASKHMQNIDEYNSQHAWRKEHNVNHLAAEEADVGTWAYPGNQPSKEVKPVT